MTMHHNFYLFLKEELELLISNLISFFKSLNKIGTYYRAALHMIMLIYPFGNLHTIVF